MFVYGEVGYMRVSCGFFTSDLTSKNHLVPVSKMAVPSFIVINSSLQPDLVSPDPCVTNTVFEVTGAQFSQSKTHSASGISLRFPRITRVRDDKDWSDATTLTHLQTLVRIRGCCFRKTLISRVCNSIAFCFWCLHRAMMVMKIASLTYFVFAGSRLTFVRPRIIGQLGGSAQRGSILFVVFSGRACRCGRCIVGERIFRRFARFYTLIHTVIIVIVIVVVVVVLIFFLCVVVMACHSCCSG
jgi:hypothetical protein